LTADPTEPAVVATSPYCGTEYGYQLHWKRGEPKDEECLAAHAVHTREGNARRGGRSPRRSAAVKVRCGTTTGYRQHRELGQVPDDRCVLAHRVALLQEELVQSRSSSWQLTVEQREAVRGHADTYVYRLVRHQGVGAMAWCFRRLLLRELLEILDLRGRE
jgi:hypothetical protein